ncbi:MAG TPA: DUF397 domain-containing protein [Actinophytocola sp.]|uniref:DUF397 domain-containing protein n=1 Tax=Actinophytocola sp. TaxID=1872138 RepID=UPI002DDD2961|nr:DUF397 domain-containing protein [Actinophytocola sp.]HEV2779125.1 DUF397 domain-containing protein [Actinophytocola sp.]
MTQRPALALWRKSSQSDNAAACVEVMALDHEMAVRDSKHPDGPVLLFATGSFRSFLQATRGR